MAEIAIILGSDSDIGIFNKTKEVLDYFGVSYEKRIISAHRTPDILKEYIKECEGRGIKLLIAIAGMSAALPGVIASITNLPVIGVPVYKEGTAFGGMDALLSIVQMPAGVPVAAVSVNGGKNAALLALRILALNNDTIRDKLSAYVREQRNKVVEKDEKFRKI